MANGNWKPEKMEYRGCLLESGKGTLCCCKIPYMLYPLRLASSVPSTPVGDPPLAFAAKKSLLFSLGKNRSQIPQVIALGVIRVHPRIGGEPPISSSAGMHWALPFMQGGFYACLSLRAGQCKDAFVTLANPLLFQQSCARHQPTQRQPARLVQRQTYDA